MNIRPIFVRLESNVELAAARERHLDGLLAAQDALLETLVATARMIRIDAMGERGIGYCAIHDGSTLVEYHVEDAFVPYAHELLRQLVEHERITGALVKSFDHVFLSSALDLAPRVEARGALAREFVPRPLPELPGIHYTRRVAELADLPRIHAVDQRVFTDPERLRMVVERGYMHLFERHDALVGFGILRPVIPGRPDVELGIAVDRPFRNRGYAVYMLRDMAMDCLDHGLRPITGCAMDNTASKLMGLRAGFVARYRMLALRFG